MDELVELSGILEAAAERILRPGLTDDGAHTGRCDA
jgi:hypothetical protein